MIANSRRADAPRTATLLGAHSLRIGKIAFYRGEPSWVFMNIEGSAYDGRAVCKLRGPNGTTLVSGAFDVDNGSGQFAAGSPAGHRRGWRGGDRHPDGRSRGDCVLC